jgi:hypothetical protein
MTAHLERSVLRDRKGTQTAGSGFEQPERQEEDDKHMARPETRTNEVRCCYLVFASIENMYGSNGAPFSTSYLGDTADIIFGCGTGALNHARTYDMPCQGVSEVRPSYAARRFADGRW